MLKRLFHHCILPLLLVLANFTLVNAQTFTPEDRARLMRTEIKLEELEKRMIERFDQVDKRFEQVDKRFEQVDKRFEENFNYIGYMIALFGSMFAATLAFAFWDRRTMIRPFESKVNEIEAEIIKLKKDKNSGKILTALRDLAKTDVKLAEILKSHNLL